MNEAAVPTSATIFPATTTTMEPTHVVMTTTTSRRSTSDTTHHHAEKASGVLIRGVPTVPITTMMEPTVAMTTARRVTTTTPNNTTAKNAATVATRRHDVPKAAANVGQQQPEQKTTTTIQPNLLHVSSTDTTPSSFSSSSSSSSSANVKTINTLRNQSNTNGLLLKQPQLQQKSKTDCIPSGSVQNSVVNDNKNKSKHVVVVATGKSKPPPPLPSSPSPPPLAPSPGQIMTHKSSRGGVAPPHHSAMTTSSTAAEPPPPVPTVNRIAIRSDSNTSSKSNSILSEKKRLAQPGFLDRQKQQQQRTTTAMAVNNSPQPLRALSAPPAGAAGAAEVVVVVPNHTSSSSSSNSNGSSSILSEKMRLAQPGLERQRQQQQQQQQQQRTTVMVNNSQPRTLSAPAAAVPNTSSSSSSSGNNILAEKMRLANRNQQQPQQQVVLSNAPENNNSNNTTSMLAEKKRVSRISYLERNHQQQQLPCTVEKNHAALGEKQQQQPGAIYIDGWNNNVDVVAGSGEERRRVDNETTTTETTATATATARGSPPSSPRRFSNSTFPSSSFSNNPQHNILCAELVDEDEIKQRAREEAQSELKRMMNEADVATATLVDNDDDEAKCCCMPMINKWRRHWPLIIAGSILAVVATVVWIWVTVALLISRDDGGNDNNNDSPNTTQALLWHQVGGTIFGINASEVFGVRIDLSADGNTLVSRSFPDGVHTEVRAYRYTDTSTEWKQLGQNITFDKVVLYEDELSLSPNGNFLAIIYSPSSDLTFLRTFALSGDSASDSIDVLVWEQIGNDIVSPQNSSMFGLSVSLTDNLILAISDSDDKNKTDPGGVYVYQYDKSQSDWVSMGQEIKGTMDPQFGYSLQLAVNSTGAMLLGVYGSLHFRTYRYEQSADSWIQFGSDLQGDDEIASDFNGPGEVALSSDGSTLATGVRNEAGGFGFGHFRVFSYDAKTDDWVQLGNDVQNESVVFGEFSLSANGKVLATTTQGLETVRPGYFITGQVRIWDFIANGDTTGGEWIQRGETVKAVDQFDYFGWRVELSADGNRFATSAIYAADEQDQATGSVQVYEVEAIV